MLVGHQQTGHIDGTLKLQFSSKLIQYKIHFNLFFSFFSYIVLHSFLYFSFTPFSSIPSFHVFPSFLFSFSFSYCFFLLPGFSSFSEAQFTFSNIFSIIFSLFLLPSCLCRISAGFFQETFLRVPYKIDKRYQLTELFELSCTSISKTEIHVSFHKMENKTKQCLLKQYNKMPNTKVLVPFESKRQMSCLTY